MLKTACVFDREQLKDFYKKIGSDISFDNFTMFFAIYENEELIGILRMKEEGGRCRILEAEKTPSLGKLEEEFLVKSAINYALTFNTKEIIMSKHYESFLFPMNFEKVGEDLVGSVEKIDFPSKCKDNH